MPIIDEGYFAPAQPMNRFLFWDCPAFTDAAVRALAPPFCRYRRKFELPTFRRLAPAPIVSGGGRRRVGFVATGAGKFKTVEKAARCFVSSARRLRPAQKCPPLVFIKRRRRARRRRGAGKKRRRAEFRRDVSLAGPRSKNPAPPPLEKDRDEAAPPRGRLRNAVRQWFAPPDCPDAASTRSPRRPSAPLPFRAMARTAPRAAGQGRNIPRR